MANLLLLLFPMTCLSLAIAHVIIYVPIVLHSQDDLKWGTTTLKCGNVLVDHNFPASASPYEDVNEKFRKALHKTMMQSQSTSMSQSTSKPQWTSMAQSTSKPQWTFMSQSTSKPLWTSMSQSTSKPLWTSMSQSTTKPQSSRLYSSIVDALNRKKPSYNSVLNRVTLFPAGNFSFDFGFSFNFMGTFNFNRQ